MSPRWLQPHAGGGSGDVDIGNGGVVATMQWRPRAFPCRLLANGCDGGWMVLAQPSITSFKVWSARRSPSRTARSPRLAQLEAQAGGCLRQGRDGLHGQPGPADPADAGRRGGDLLLRALCALAELKRLGQAAVGAVRFTDGQDKPGLRASVNFTKKEPDLTKKMVAAHVKATKEMASNPAIAIETTIKPVQDDQGSSGALDQNLFFSADSGAGFVNGLKALAR